MSESHGLTPASLELFRALAADAGNWSGTPLVEVSKEERGNLTQLKRAGLLVTTSERERINGTVTVLVWATFTYAGAQLAARLGIALDDAWLAR